jgi:hypothetical protein
MLHGWGIAGFLFRFITVFAPYTKLLLGQLMYQNSAETEF